MHNRGLSLTLFKRMVVTVVTTQQSMIGEEVVMVEGVVLITERVVLIIERVTNTLQEVVEMMKQEGILLPLVVVMMLDIMIR